MHNECHLSLNFSFFIFFKKTASNFLQQSTPNGKETVILNNTLTEMLYVIHR